MSEAPEARPAATVALVRAGPEGGAGLEVLLALRHAKMAFMGQVWVFPGGKVDAEDLLGEGRPDGPSDADLGARRAAIRETHEEVGITLGGPDDLIPFARWVTPASEPRRFDTRFYLAVVPRGLELTLATDELSAALWLTPAEALARHGRGELALAPPTWWTLEALRRTGDLTATAAWARGEATRGLPPLTPTLRLEGGGVVVSVPGEAVPLPSGEPVSGRLVMRRGVWSAD